MPPRFPAHTLTSEPAMTTAATEAKKLCVLCVGGKAARKAGSSFFFACALPATRLAQACSTHAHAWRGCVCDACVVQISGPRGGQARRTPPPKNP